MVNAKLMFGSGADTLRLAANSETRPAHPAQARAREASAMQVREMRGAMNGSDRAGSFLSQNFVHGFSLCQLVD